MSITSAVRPDESESPPRSLTVLDVFSGAGGMTQGFHAAQRGFRTVMAVEQDPAAAASFSATFGTPVFIGPVQQWLADGDVPEVDVAVGGPPCQGFSTLGKQDVEDERNLLWRYYAQALQAARPRYFVLENVPAFQASPQLRHLTEETRRGGLLEDYAFEARVLNAADYGAAQARRRVVLIGHHRDLPPPGFPKPTHVGAHRTVRQALTGVPHRITRTDLRERHTVVDGKSLPGPFATRELHVGRTYTATSKARIRMIPPGGNRFDIADELLPRCWREHSTGSADVMGRLHWDRPSVTIRTEFHKPEKGRYLHPSEDRAITHYEAALLQGFPEIYRWVGSKTSIARQIGNAVPIPLGAAIGRRLAEAWTR